MLAVEPFRVACHYYCYRDHTSLPIPMQPGRLLGQGALNNRRSCVRPGVRIVPPCSSTRPGRVSLRKENSSVKSGRGTRYSSVIYSFVGSSFETGLASF
jgi:hypothetical protein